MLKPVSFSCWYQQEVVRMRRQVGARAQTEREERQPTAVNLMQHRPDQKILNIGLSEAGVHHGRQDPQVIAVELILAVLSRTTVRVLMCIISSRPPRTLTAAGCRKSATRAWPERDDFPTVQP